MIITNHKEISLTVNFLSDPDQLLGTRDRAEPTTLATLTINFNLCHVSIPTPGIIPPFPPLGKGGVDGFVRWLLLL